MCDLLYFQGLRWFVFLQQTTALILAEIEKSKFRAKIEQNLLHNKPIIKTNESFRSSMMTLTVSFNNLAIWIAVKEASMSSNILIATVKKSIKPTDDREIIMYEDILTE